MGSKVKERNLDFLRRMYLLGQRDPAWTVRALLLPCLAISTAAGLAHAAFLTCSTDSVLMESDSAPPPEVPQQPEVTDVPDMLLTRGSTSTVLLSVGVAIIGVLCEYLSTLSNHDLRCSLNNMEGASNVFVL